MSETPARVLEAVRPWAIPLLAVVVDLPERGTDYVRSENDFQTDSRRRDPREKIHEDELCIAFYDVNTQAPIHVLIIPRREIVSLEELADGDETLIGHLFVTASKLAPHLKLDSGYPTVINCGDDGGQSVPHLHVHLPVGRKLSWPPG